MSRENVDLGRRAYDAFNRRDWNAFLALTDADVHHVPLAAAIDGDYLGHDGMRSWFTSLLDAFPDFTIEVVDVRDLGDLTLANLRTRGHGAGGGAPFDMAVWQVAEWRDGKFVWSGSYQTEAEALEAVASRE
jgi:ketosteroid isomerase-like protein